MKGETERPLPEKKLLFKCNTENKENFEIPLLQIEKSNMKEKVKNPDFILFSVYDMYFIFICFNFKELNNFNLAFGNCRFIRFHAIYRI